MVNTVSVDELTMLLCWAVKMAVIDFNQNN